MRLRALVTGTESDLDVRQEGERVFASLDGRDYELGIQDSGENAFLITRGARVFDCRVEGRAESGGSVDVFVGTERYTVTLTDLKRLRGTAATIGRADQAARITAPMPGKVVRILVEIGTEVEAGAGVVVVEAMKMQNEMKSPKKGRVTVLNVPVGATVNGGDVLAVIE